MSSAKTKVCIVVLCGLPGSGKTSLSLEIRKWLLRLNDIIPVIISYDQLMPPSIESELIKPQSEEKSKWKKYRAAILSCIHNFIINIQSEPITGTKQTLKDWVSRDISKDTHETNTFNDLHCDVHDKLMKQFTKLINEQMIGVTDDMDELRRKIVVIIDDNMYYRSMRYDYYQLARSSSLGFCEIYIACTMTMALQRNSQRREDFVEPEIITNMEKKFQIPDKSLHSWEKYSLICSLDNTQICRMEILDLIHTALQNPVEPIEEIDPDIIVESQKICSANLVHQADLILRQLISDRMIRQKDSKMSKVELKKTGKQLTDRKSQILQEFREGKITSTITEDEINDSSKVKTNAFYILVKQKFDKLISS